MAKTAQDYPVTFGYLAKTTLNGQPYTHRGTDRKCPTGTPIVISGTTIGLTGNTGLTTGPHLHLQAGTDLACQNTVNPEPYAFKVGKVVALRTVDEKAWGKYITIQVGAKYITYAHLSQVNVTVGQIIQGGEMAEIEDLKNQVSILVNERDNVTYPQIADLKNQVQILTNERDNVTYPEIKVLKQQVANLQTVLANEQNKPPKEIVKEVQVIVERLVEVSKPVDEELVVKNWFKRLVDKALGFLFRKDG